MGAAFSPTVVNIYMSILLKNFLHTTNQKPLLLKRYIDDIFLIWPPENQDFTTFVQFLNSYHPNIKFTATSSSTSINFLDLTMYKGQLLTINDLLDIKTFQRKTTSSNTSTSAQTTQNLLSNPLSLASAPDRSKPTQKKQTITTKYNY